MAMATPNWAQKHYFEFEKQKKDVLRGKVI
jgi:hypothetical protein